MVAELAEIGLRIKGLREACDVTPEDMAAELEVPLDKYLEWEETGADVPISAIYHLAHTFGVEFTEILTGTAAKLNTYQVVKKGEGREVDRYPGYHFEDLAWRYTGKIMQPLLVVLDPSDEPAKLVTHTGQEFNLVLEGTVVVTWEDKEFELHAGDSIYFQPGASARSALRKRRARQVRHHHRGGDSIRRSPNGGFASRRCEALRWSIIQPSPVAYLRYASSGFHGNLSHRSASR